MKTTLKSIQNNVKCQVVFIGKLHFVALVSVLTVHHSMLWYDSVIDYLVHEYRLQVFCPGCYWYCVARGSSLQLLLTQADIVVEKHEEVIALFPVVATRCAGAPGSHIGCRVVKVVGSYCASCRGKFGKLKA